MSPSLSSRQRMRLIRRLRAAHASLHAWELSLRGEPAGDGGQPGALEQSLLALLHEAGLRIDRRLIELGAARAAAPLACARRRRRVASPRLRRPARPAESLGLRACRACGEALGAAFREAQSAADTASAQSLYGSLRAFEKHLWVLDPLQTR